MTHETVVAQFDEIDLCKFVEKCDEKCDTCAERLVTGYENDLLQDFAQWLWDNKYLTNEAFTIRLVDEYRGKRGTK